VEERNFAVYPQGRATYEPLERGIDGIKILSNAQRVSSRRMPS